MTKRLMLVLVAVAALALLVPSVAMANYAIHGNYVTDTDACAGCHRAHTSVSSIQWSDSLGNQHNALLTSAATKMQDFCLTCHDASAQGADTNVTDGLYEGSLYGGSPANLNGGGFETFNGQPVTSRHDSESNLWGAYGGGLWGAGDSGATGQNLSATSVINGSTFYNAAGESAPIVMDCATCHDPHGSSNYRILKAQVYGNTVGGYQADGTPDGYVSSVETGWPAGGFRLHTQYPNYVPNYIDARYAKGYNQPTGAVNAAKGMTGWCSGCHTTYNDSVNGTFTSVYDAGDAAGLVSRHRHPVNVPLSNYVGVGEGDSLVLNSGLPLAHSLDESATGPSNTSGDWIECLTCHRAHGTSAIMTGYASNAYADSIDQPYASPGINSENPSALLRTDNRGVCEACHNK